MLLRFRLWFMGPKKIAKVIRAKPAMGRKIFSLLAPKQALRVFVDLVSDNNEDLTAKLPMDSVIKALERLPIERVERVVSAVGVRTQVSIIKALTPSFAWRLLARFPAMDRRYLLETVSSIATALIMSQAPAPLLVSMFVDFSAEKRAELLQHFDSGTALSCLSALSESEQTAVLGQIKVRTLAKLINEADPLLIGRLLRAIPAYTAALALEQSTSEAGVEAMRQIRGQERAGILERVSESFKGKCLELMPSNERGPFLLDLDAAGAAEILRSLPTEELLPVLEDLPAEPRVEILQYVDDTLMQRVVPRLSAGAVAEVLSVAAAEAGRSFIRNLTTEQFEHCLTMVPPHVLGELLDPLPSALSLQLLLTAEPVICDLVLRKMPHSGDDVRKLLRLKGKL
ncbi:MAG: hypothetical protein HYV63_15090 [Candidatus Schekmanbacteria bacterium]|nr:hypothetical protein [Candidatus Schekmanbacteria bacterium]